jgi:L-ascorbate metabolism protein UlaG (beta-lactamase superfamily)
MDDFDRKQAQIASDRRIAAAHYQQTWDSMIKGWGEDCSAGQVSDSAWLMYAANYLLCTDGVRWAIDPYRLKRRIPSAPDVDAARDLAGLSFIVLTHLHADHVDPDLLIALRDLPVQWIVAESVLPFLRDRVGPPEERVIVPHMLEPLRLGGVKLTPFPGMHWHHFTREDAGLREDAGRREDLGQTSAGRSFKGVPATGFLAEFSGKRWLFPGDTRTYDAHLLPDFGPVDGVFAHVWLGGHAARSPEPPQLDAFCRFCSDLRPRRLVLAHLREFGREADEYWDSEHVQMITARLREIAPQMEIIPAYMGDRVEL